LRFLIDMPITPLAVRQLEAAGHDAVHASQAGLATASDQEILEVAKREGRIVVTADLDYPRVLARSGAQGPGLILFRGGSYSDDQMLLLLDRVLTRASDLDLQHPSQSSSEAEFDDVLFLSPSNAPARLFHNAAH